jgi:pimeloyl-ACP methyl ester carboxylesterase
VRPYRTEQLKDRNRLKDTYSIAEKCFVEINGVTMGMIIRSKNLSNPVMLFVHGGPGMPEYFLFEKYPTGLEDAFTVVYWDQRGAGLSYNRNIDKSTLSVDHYIEDVIAVTSFLQERKAAP